MKTIVVVGGGFAGVRVAPDLTARAIPNCENLRISEESDTTITRCLALGAAEGGSDGVPLSNGTP